ncbi:cyclic nucleotide-binding domain protein (macronuclear) [Tetrahymena thermophila SB210]|uniref:Cyclic nucleotide-binding domain protein n=1 Tax=Tetrahymena thermophila (strain SB210) TaxID=312017 RepID=I7MDM2_TETTS|nr:cyclic nucleotide-binding domain protein [Tetrahymena thermophila SB210]EAR89394.2 cyclic nucleotide-binding domain protein [Tetrahymena thermophila SB210]|eukprot:XP_001009639.2 cyclic nucleotide-binding domain protein [Tetrahymena thermophila SB210]
MRNSYSIKEVDKLLRNQNKSLQDVEKIQQFLYSLPYFQNLFNEIHKSLIPKLIRKFQFSQCEAGGAIIESGSRIKDFFIILEGTCLEMNKQKHQEADEQSSVAEDLEKTPYLKILKQSEERKKSLLFQQTPIHQNTTKSQTSRFREESQLLKIESMDESEQTVTAQTPLPQKSQFFQNSSQVRSDIMEDYFVQQYKRKYEKKGYNILNTLKEGDFFGGITKKGAEQTFSDILCCTKVEYVCLCFEDYWSILSMYQLRMCEQKIAFLRSYRFLQIYSDHYLNKRLNMFEEVSFNRNQVLFEENELSSYIYFFYEGEFVMNKNIDFKKYLDCMLNNNSNSNNQNLFAKNTQIQQLQRSNQNSEQTTSESDENHNQNICCSGQFKKNVIISYLNPGSYIGLSELLTDSKYTYTVSCFSTHAKVYRLYKENFEKFFKCEANIEIMAQDCLGKEKIYEEILQKHANMMIGEYSKMGENQTEKEMINIFEISKKKNNNNSNVLIPHQHSKSDVPKFKKDVSVIDQRIEEKLNSQSGKISRKDIQKEKSQNLQDTILNSINNDPYFRRKLLNNLSSLGFKINHDNCNIYNHLKLQTNYATSRTSSLSNLQECISKTKQETLAQNQPYQGKLEQIPEVLASNMSIQDNNKTSNANSNINANQQSFRVAQKQNNTLNCQSLQELQRKRLSFILGCQDKKQFQQKSSTTLQRQTSIDQEDGKVKFENSPSIEDLKCFENNITYRKENQTEPNSPQAQYDQPNFNSKTSIVFSNNDQEFLTATSPYELSNPQQNNQQGFQNNLRMKSLSPQRKLKISENIGSQQSSCQQTKYLSPQTNSNPNFIIKKDQLISRKAKLESVLSAQNSKKQYLVSPKKDEEYISPIVSPFQTFRQKLYNNFCNSNNINFSEAESPIKFQQSNTNTSHNNSLQLKLLNQKPQQNSQLHTQGLNKLNQVCQPQSSSPSEASKIQLKQTLLNVNPQQQQSQTSLAQCSISFSNQNKRQNSVSNFQFNLQGGNTNNKDYKNYLEQIQQQQQNNNNNSNINNNLNNKNQNLNIHLRAKSQKSFRDKLHILVDKHIQDNLNHRKSYIFNNHNTSTNKVSIQTEYHSQQLKPAQITQTSKININNIPTESISSVRFEHVLDYGSQANNHSNSQLSKNVEQKSPKVLNIAKKKQKSLLHFNYPSQTHIMEDNTIVSNQVNTTLQSPIVNKQAAKMLHKRCSIPLMSPTSTKITQLSTAHSPSFSSFQTVINKHHSRMASDQSCSYINQNIAKNQYI